MSPMIGHFFLAQLGRNTNNVRLCVPLELIRTIDVYHILDPTICVVGFEDGYTDHRLFSSDYFVAHIFKLFLCLSTGRLSNIASTSHLPQAPKVISHPFPPSSFACRYVPSNSANDQSPLTRKRCVCSDPSQWRSPQHWTEAYRNSLATAHVSKIGI